ncbi:MAG: NdvB protein [Verrucomicrobiota bacterium]
MLHPTDQGERFELASPTFMPRAAGFLWNRTMMIQVTCRGFAVAQFTQPEPAKYAYAPNLEAKTFMQPEQPYYAHHPGRFVYLKDEENGDLFSAPYEPVRASLDAFKFSVGQSDIWWSVVRRGIAVRLSVTLAPEHPLELWELQVQNASARSRRLSIYPYFPIGYMSWMNQSAGFRTDLNGIVASCVTPYQKVADYFKNRRFKDKTIFLASRVPTAWEARQEAFEGDGSLPQPAAIQRELLANSDALYETPAAVLQYRVELRPQQAETYAFIFGPAFDDAEIETLRATYLAEQPFIRAARAYSNYVKQGQGCLWIETPDPHFDAFINHWLPRQVFYHGDVNRLTTDPQTRNYLQDNMGMSYIRPPVARAAFVHALSQQEPNGALPDGILLVPGAELKYINQIPHTDHCVWLPVCLRAYLDESGDWAILAAPVVDRDGRSETVFQRITRAMQWLLAARDQRGLSYIAQGDWCDPMNMVGYKGKGVSGWLSLATAYALNLWTEICLEQQQPALAEHFRVGAAQINQAVHRHLWDGNWFARGITDDGSVFGTSKDQEGRIFLNPQSWAILAGAATAEQRARMIDAVAANLETPYGVMLVAPPFTAMREDIGRVTQKFPGSAENGSVYNHAAAFYIYSLYQVHESDRAFRLLRQMIPGPALDDYERRGQLPVFVPNYYRGAYREHPRTAGRSSQLFNTGTASWIYRSVLEQLFGLKGDRQGLTIDPHLPSHWDRCRVRRTFRGATFEVAFVRERPGGQWSATVDGRACPSRTVAQPIAGQSYRVEVRER